MKEFTVLIVDDERNIAEGLKLLIERFLPWCRVAALALDGEQGYQMALKTEPDIILTDISMPQFDGIEMIRRLKEEGCGSHFIILSGYAEFEYAKSAIGLGVEGYMIKPVEENELITAFTKVRNSLLSEREQKKQMDDLKTTMGEYELKQILEAPGEKAENIRRKLSSLDFPMDGKGYVCTVWMNHDEVSDESDRDQGGMSQSKNSKNSIERKDDFCQLIREMAMQYPESCKIRFTISISITETIVAVIQILSEKKEDKLRQETEKMRLHLFRKMESVVSAGTGLCHNRAEGIRESYEEARCALNYTVVKGTDCVIRYDEINTISNISTSQNMVAMEDVKRLETCIDSMDDEGCREVVEAIFDKIDSVNSISLVDIQVLSLNLILSGIRKIPFMQLQLNNYLESNIFSLESISKFQTIDQLKNWVINMLKSMNELMLKENLPERRDVIAEIKEYMNQNYNKEISLNDIAERFYINPYYLSQLFKKKTGETYQNFLTGIRISRAKRLLKETDLKLYEVAVMIGYSDATYFSKKFERVVGMKPGEYRVRDNY